MPDNPTAVFDLLQLAERLGIAVLLGGVIGLDREWHDRPAGLRTHILVSLASALFTMLSFELFLMAEEASDSSRADPVRVVEAVLTGVAFLGAGTIIQASRRLEGVTTGASIWLVGAVGVAAGGGFYEMAAVGTSMAILVLTGLGFLERRLFDRRQGRGTGEDGPD
ncbi:MAG: MgtC/SapB family protein [Tistlia sp.]